LEKHGYDVKIIDCTIEDWRNVEHIEGDFYKVGLSWEYLEKKIKAFEPDVVGITCSFTVQSANAFKVAEITKKINHSIKVVMGGVHPSALPKETLQHECVDYVIIGEGEYSFLELIRKLERGKSVSGIDGLGFKLHEKVKINPKTKFIKNIDELPFPARHLLPIEEYFKAGKRAFHVKSEKNLSVITSRGCPFDCRFCSIHCLWGRSWRPHSPERVISEIKHLIDTYDVEEISFEDDNIILDRERFVRICEGIEPLDIKWCTPNGIRVNSLDHELLEIMKKSGCYSLNLAIEHGDPQMLNIMNKQVDLEKAKQITESCKKLGIYTFGYFVIGMPGETRETIGRSIEFAKNTALNEIGVFIATPYPGSALHQECVEKKYVQDLDWSRVFTDKAVISTPQLSASDLEDLRVKFAIEFNKSTFNVMPYINRMIKNPMLISRYIKMMMKK
jgi:magnesium-protoporphyrin IX monomethyl ester (oxidative) cyclase